MKIAVATDDNQKVAGHVGRCRAFIVFETNESQILNKEIRENSFTHHGHHHENGEEHHNHGEGHGRGHDHHNLIDGLKDCQVLIFNHAGWRLIEDLKVHNITPVLTDERLAEDAVTKYIKGELVINDENVCQGHHH